MIKESIFLDFIENTNDLIVCIDSTGSIIYSNKRWNKLLTNKKKIWEFVEKKEINTFKKTLKQVKEGKFVDGFETVFVTKDKNEIFVEGNLSPAFQKKKFYCIALFRDITTQKLEHKFFTGLWDNAPVAYHRVSTKGIIVDVNQTEVDMLGYKKEDMIGKSIFDFILPEQRDHAKKRFKEKLKGKNIGRAKERMYVKKDGTQFYVNIDDALEYDDEGKVLGIRTTMFDVTDRRKMEQKLIDSEEKLRTIFNNSAVAITVTDENERLVSWNPLTEKMLGMTHKDLYMMPVSSLYPPAEWKKIRSANIRQKGIIYHYETKLQRKDKVNVPIDISISILRESGKIVGSIGVMRNITKRRKSEDKLQKYIKEIQESRKLLENQQLELKKTNKKLMLSDKDSYEKAKILEIQSKELKEANKELLEAKKNLTKFNEKLESKVKERTQQIEIERSKIEKLLNQKTEFINQLSHDIRTPLTPIITLTSVLKLKIKDKDIQERLKIISRNADYLKTLVVDTLNLAKLDLDKIEFNFVKVNLYKLIHDLDLLNSTVLKEKKIKLVNNIFINTTVYADMLRLKEVIENLIMNSIKFMPDGGTITFNHQKVDDYDVIEFIDTGIGMKREVLDRIFDEFYKADESRHVHSSGLGLAISKRIIKKHKGSLWAESDGLNKGSRFYIKIPLIPDNLI